MSFDAVKLRDFYRSPLGQVVRRQLVSRIRERWKRLDGLTVVGAGFATPFLGSFRAEALRLGCLMPARQGALVWPHSAPNHSVLVEDPYWPLPDNSVDRLLAVHSLEQAERVGPLLREMWRVLAPNGRLLIIAPKRSGLWSRIDTTPFGYGLPFSRGQLESQLTDALFTPLDWGEALYFPPISRRIVLRSAATIERLANRAPIGVAGVMIVEARKELMAPIVTGQLAGEARLKRQLDAVIAPKPSYRVRAAGTPLFLRTDSASTATI